MSTVKQNEAHRNSKLLTIPPEIRQQILKHVLKNARMVITVYQDSVDENAFSVKTTDHHAVLKTCRQIYQEGIREYYHLVFIILKPVVSPIRPAFSGDMSKFAGNEFKSHVSRLEIGAMSEEARKRVQKSFNGLKIVLYSEIAAGGSRKSGYYYF